MKPYSMVNNNTSSVDKTQLYHQNYMLQFGLITEPGLMIYVKIIFSWHGDDDFTYVI